MRVSLMHPCELGRSEIAAWHAMQRATPSLAHPFLSPEFAMAVGHFRPGARVAVLMDGQRVCGFFPFEKRRLGAGAPICGGLTERQGVIHAPEVDWDPRELLRGCHISAWRFDNLIIDQQPFVPYHSAVVPSPTIDLSDGFEAYYEDLRARSQRFCKEIARRARKLERELGELRVVADSCDPRELRTLMAWKSEQYRQSDHVDRFEQPWLVELLEVLLATHTPQLSGLLSALYAGDHLVAAQFGLRTEALLVGWFTAYDTSLGKYSPGLIHIKGLAEEMAAAGIRAIDMGGGAKNYYKETMKSYDSLVAQGVVTSRSVLGAAHHARSSLSRTARLSVHRHPVLHAATRKVLRQSGLAHRLWGRI
ncbi:MAG TPA: GNAT family N-acetyltransferase [Trebonia sp.]|nr:GNAT family N-acetyltransferase [Trebonia sp.]